MSLVEVSYECAVPTVEYVESITVKADIPPKMKKLQGTLPTYMPLQMQALPGGTI